MPGTDWWEPLGEPGRIEVREVVDDDTVHERALATENVREITLAEIGLCGRSLTAEVGHRAYALRDGEDTVVRVELPSGKGRPWVVDVAGRELAMTYERMDLAREDSKTDQVLFLLLCDSGGSWVAHYTGGRLAGEQIVLSRGAVPRSSPAVVTCVPAARSRELPRSRLRRRQPADRHVTSWTAEATGAEVALAEMILLGRLHNGIDYLAASFVGAAREIAGIWRVFTPMPEPLPTKDDG
jgi:hypothetical protein